MSTIFHDGNQGEWPAYPQDAEQGNCEFWKHGMTLRDAFAIAALNALHGTMADIFTASLCPPDQLTEKEAIEYAMKRIAALATVSYGVANAMLAERIRGIK